jgi:2-dehydro-3-deoxygalactonokinase
MSASRSYTTHMSERISWTDGFIAVDWGTTNRRAFLVQADGRHTEKFEDGLGILSVRRGQFEGAIEQLRERLGDLPMLLAGMVGSNRGWIEAPYVPCPARMEDLVSGLVLAGRAAIVPGVSLDNGRCDVMRGEEVQILGAVSSGAIPEDCLVCHPGTHNKWVKMSGGRIHSFRTVMTGEIFNLLRGRSILSDLLSGRASEGETFREGVRQGLSGAGVAADLFEVRARFLLGRLDQATAPSLVSGILIGHDIRVGLAEYPGSQMVVMGGRNLTSLYRAALGEAGVEAKEVDGEEAFIAGARKIVELIE